VGEARQDQIQRTTLLILRRTPYSDTSIVVAGVSPSYGRLSLLARGARRVGKKQFPLLDLFRIVEVTFGPARGDLAALRDADIVEDFRDVSRDLRCLDLAAWMGRVALSNLGEHAPCPRFYQALCAAFRRLAHAASTGKPSVGRAAVLSGCIVTGTGLVLLDEQGLLARPDSPDARKRLERLLEMGEGKSPPPRLDPRVWERLSAWTLRVMRRAGLTAPPPPSGRR